MQDRFRARSSGRLSGSPGAAAVVGSGGASHRARRGFGRRPWQDDRPRDRRPGRTQPRFLPRALRAPRDRRRRACPPRGAYRAGCRAAGAVGAPSRDRRGSRRERRRAVGGERGRGARALPRAGGSGGRTLLDIHSARTGRDDPRPQRDVVRRRRGQPRRRGRGRRFRRPVRHASPTVAACLPAVGINGAGLAQGIDSLSARDDRVGIPRVLVSRHALEAGSAEDAPSAGQRFPAGRAATPMSSPCAAATPSPSRRPRPRAPSSQARRRTRTTTSTPALHWRGSAERGQPRPPGTARRRSCMSGRRRPRRTQWSSCATTPRLRRRSASIPIPPTETRPPPSSSRWSASSKQGRMWVAPGNPCDTPYEEVDVTDVV